MVKLTDTSNVTIGKTIQVQDQDFIEISGIGDGNCALNSLSLWLIDHLLKLKNNEKAFDLNKQAMNELIREIIASIDILKERQKLYAGKSSSIQGNAYTDLADPLQRFINFITEKKSSPTIEDLVNYIHKQADPNKGVEGARKEIAALHVALAPAFRAIGAKRYLANLKTREIDDEEMLDDANLFFKDGVSVDHSVLVAIGEVFKMNVVIFNNTTQLFVLAPEDNQAKLTVYIHHVPGHYNYLTPKLEEDGLKSVLSNESTKDLDATIVKENADHHLLKDEIDTLLLWEENTKKRVSHLETICIQNELEAIAAVAETVSKNLKAIEEKINILPDEIKKAALNSDQLLANVKNKLDITEDKVDSFAHDDFTKELLLNEQSDPSSYKDDPDEALARYLQNAEILSFLNKNVNFFKKPSKKIAEQPQTPTTTPQVNK